MSKKALKKANLRLRNEIESLANEIENLEEKLQVDHEKLWTVIQENDRLTLRYEPFRPEGDEHRDYDFYELIEENDALTQNVLDKLEVIRELEKENNELKYLVREMCPPLDVLEEAEKVEPWFPNKVKKKKSFWKRS